MVSPSFVMQAYSVKNDVTRRNVNFRQTNLRYFVVVIAIFVVFGCEYCFDTPSVSVLSLRPCRPKSKITTLTSTSTSISLKLNLTCFIHCMRSPT